MKPGRLYDSLDIMPMTKGDLGIALKFSLSSAADPL